MRVFYWLVISVLVHFILYSVMQKMPDFQNRKAIDVTILDPSSQNGNRRQIIQSPDTGEKLDKENPKAKVFSKDNLATTEEMVKRGDDAHSPVSNLSPKMDYKSPTKKKTAKAESETVKAQNKPDQNSQNASTDVIVNKALRKKESGEDGGMALPFAANYSLGEAGISDYIPDVKEGGFTAVNTSGLTYYTFFERIKPRIRSQWVTALNSYRRDAPLSELQQLSAQTRITDVEVTLDNSGHYKEIMVVRSSGYRGLDDAVRVAFQKATPFVNPPKELIKEGEIRLRFAFYLLWQPLNTVAR